MRFKPLVFFVSALIARLLIAAPLLTAPPVGMAQEDDIMPPITEAAVIDLGGAWTFWTDADGEASAVEVSVPHTWGVMEQYADYEGVAWYQRTFNVSPDLRNAHIRLRFDAVFYAARVWLNEVELGAHEGGYTPFSFPISDALRFDAPNVLRVQVDNARGMDRIPATLRPGWSFDWWNWGGIVRDVKLLVSSPLYIERAFITAEPDLVDSADIRVRARLISAWSTDAEADLVLSIQREDSGAVVWSEADDPALRQSLSLAAGETHEPVINTTLPDPRLWHFDFPHLYTLTAELQDPAGNVIHRVETTFGVRRIELRDARFYLNGEWVRLVGLTRHADSPQHGLAEPVSFMAADYDDLKRLNMVFSRPVHYPQHEFIMDYCDRHGILLIPEVPAWQLTSAQMGNTRLRELHQQQIREMIEQDFNHPSVWAWSIGNEYESETFNGQRFTLEMAQYIRELDPDRYVSYASNRLGSVPQRDAMEYADFVMMNQYFGTWVGPKQGLGPALDVIHAAWPDKLVIISEFGFEPRWNRFWGPPTDSLNRDQHYFVTDDELNDPVAIDRERQKVLTEQMAVFRERPYVGGAVFWTYQDYRTPSGFEMGLVDAQRQPSPAYDVLQIEFAPALFQAITHDADSFTPGQPVATQVTLWNRGPVEEQMPAYTLREYTLEWALHTVGAPEPLDSGSLALPTLTPGETWTGEIAWAVPENTSPGAAAYQLELTIVRPTGFASLTQTVSLPPN